VNFTAFATRFQITCWRRVGSATIEPRDGANEVVMVICFAAAVGLTASTAFMITRAMSTVSGARRSFPETTRETSRMSSMRRA
jgi:hypothetical protein